MSSPPEWVASSAGDVLSNGTSEVETMVALHCPSDSGGVTADSDRLSLSNDGMSEFSNSDLSLPEVCISSNSNSFEEDMSYEVQQAYRIFTGFLLDKHKGITGPFLNPVGHQEAQHGIGGVKGRGQSQLKQSMCLRRMEEKFIGQEYETITEFVTDFRWMLENCYRYHGVDHWVSKQAQKLEIMLEQKLTLLSRALREKTTLAVTSKGRFGAEEDRSSGGTTTRRRLATRSLATLTVGGHESLMVQSLRLEEQQRAKEEKRQRELEKKEAEEMSAKEVDEWEQSLLSQAAPQAVDTLWELPAIGHFLCLAQTALNLPEVVFFELERCLLMPRCSLLLSKIMSSLLSPSQRRATLHRRPALPYRRWESELRQRVVGWYRTVGASRDQRGRAEQLGLCQEFFRVLGEVSPLEERPFHLLPFHQRVWLLKGLCDHVYEMQKDVQDAVLAQPIHECRESILGYDSKENAYIHFPHFCGADLRIYCQCPSTPPAFPFPCVLVRKVEKELVSEDEESDGVKDEEEKNDSECYGAPTDTEELTALGKSRSETLSVIKKEKGKGQGVKTMFESWSLMKEELSESGSSDSDSCEDSKMDLKIRTNSLSLIHVSPSGREGGGGVQLNVKEETSDDGRPSKRFLVKQEQGCSLGSVRVIKDTQEPCLNVGEHSYTGRSPARSVTLPSPTKTSERVDGGSPGKGQPRSSTWDHCQSKTSIIKCEVQDCGSGSARLTMQLSSESAQNSSEERLSDKIWTKKKRWKKKRGRGQPPRARGERGRPPAEAAKSVLRKVTATIKRKGKKKKHKTGKKSESSKKIKEEVPVEPPFKLVCTSLEELRELISKTEDELDDLESTKKRLGRWYYRREAVKDLHSTLIRLLNELSPWEPKLIRAYQRNRLRLKKEFDDFKKHPEYNNFVREECLSSSSEDDDEEERDLGKEVCLLTDHYGRSEEEDLEHVVPRGLWTGASTREFESKSAAEKTMSYIPPNNMKHLLTISEKDVSLLSSVQTVSVNTTCVDSKQLSGMELIPTNQSKDSGSVANVSVFAPAASRSPILHPTSGLPKGYTPIPTFLAKSVGNKVTLMKRPSDFPGVSSGDGHSKGSSLWLPKPTLGSTKLSEAQSPLSSFQPRMQQGSPHTQALGHPGMTTVTPAPPKAPQNKPTQTVPKNSVQVVYKVPEGLGHLVKKDSSGPIKFSVHPVVDQNTGEKIMQQVVILPSNLLIHKSDAKAPSLYQQPSKGCEVTASKAASPLCMSTDVPGFCIPENRIPVQQVAPLKGTRTVHSPPPSILPCLQQGATSTSGFKATQICSVQGTKPEGVPPKPPTITTLSSAVSTEPVKTTDPKQELKTVCIRDSQSILVTTRGGNTGIVKVQTSSDHSALGSFSTSPVITISPQFKAFLISKTLSTLSQPSASTDQALSTSSAESQKQTSSIVKPTSTITNSVCTAVTGSIPIKDPGSHNTGMTVAFSQGSNTSTGSTGASKIAHLVQTTAAGSQIQASMLKNSIVVPSQSRSTVPQLLSQGFVNKTGVKRASTDKGSHVPKFILVAPTSSSASNVTLPKGTTTSTKSVPTSRVMIIGQPTVPSSTNFMGGIPNQAMVTAGSGQATTTSLPSQTLKMARPVGSEALANANNITVPSGAQIQLSGKTTTIGQTIGALSYSPSKCPPVSVSGTLCPIATTTGPVPITSLITFKNCSSQPNSYGCLTASSEFQGIPTISKISQTSGSTHTHVVSTLTAGSPTVKDLGMPAGVVSNNTIAAQVASTAKSSPVQTFTFGPDSQLSSLQSGMGWETPSSISSSQLVHNTSQTALSSTPPNCTPSTPSPAGTVQQRVVINTSTPLAAGTQILLNNTYFVVPPQGLGPGSHVLIISSPAPQVPNASPTSTGASVPYQGASNATIAPLAPVLPQSTAGQPAVSAVPSPFVTCTSAVGPSLLSSTPHVAPVKQTGAGLSSVLLPCKTSVVSALPRLPATQAGLPALVSPVVTSATAFGSSLAAVRLATPAQAESSSIISPTVVPTFARLPQSLSSLTPSTSAVALPSPVMPVSSPSPLPSSPALVVADKPALHCSVPTQQIVTMTSLGTGIQPQQTAVRIAAPFAGQPQALVPKGLGNISIRKQAPVIQPVLAGTRTQILPTVAVPPIVSAVSRIQTLPIATVPPIGSTVNMFETAALGPELSSNTTLTFTPGQPIASLKTNNTLNSPVILTNQSFGKLSPQSSTTGRHSNMASHLLISPDGAVLSTVQSHMNLTELTACPKPLEALEISTNSSTGALQTHDSSLQPLQSDTK